MFLQKALGKQPVSQYNAAKLTTEKQIFERGDTAGPEGNWKSAITTHKLALLTEGLRLEESSPFRYNRCLTPSSDHFYDYDPGATLL